MFKPSLKKNKKNISKAVKRSKPKALEAVIEDSLKELGAIRNNKKGDNENNQKTASKVSSNTIEKVDENNPNRAGDSKYNKKEVKKQLEEEKVGTNTIVSCQDSGSVNMRDPKKNNNQ